MVLEGVPLKKEVALSLIIDSLATRISLVSLNQSRKTEKGPHSGAN